MSEHYYSNKPSVASDVRLVSTSIHNSMLSFETDAGVFSKKGVDFGTVVLLENLTIAPKAKTVADIGCGYGPIGIYVAKNNDVFVQMVDVNERAVALSKRNAQRNGVAERVDVKESFLLDSIADQVFDCIISNPPIRAGKEVVHQLFDQAYQCLQAEGEFWIVIQRKQGAPSAIAKLETLFAEVDVVKKEKGYYIIKSKKS
ncbi:MAG: class I SAM-dependent methyltransferase [Bacilli bacterium]